MLSPEKGPTDVVAIIASGIRYDSVNVHVTFSSECSWISTRRCDFRTVSCLSQVRVMSAHFGRAPTRNTYSPAGTLKDLVLDGVPLSTSVNGAMPLVPVKLNGVLPSGWVCRMIVMLPFGLQSLSRLVDCSHGA